MIKTYLKIALRNIVRRKSHSLINIVGLGVGIAACLLLFQVIRYETSYEKFQPEYPNIYRVVTQDKFAEGVTFNPGVPVPLVSALRLEIPGVTFAAIDAIYGSQLTVAAGNGSTNNKYIEESGMFFCEPAFFKVFSYPWLVGNASVLQQPNSVVLTKSMANKYFGDWTRAVGQTLQLDNAITLKVAAILEDVPVNSDLPLHVLVSMSTLDHNGELYNYYKDSWGHTSSSFEVFARLPANMDTAVVNARLLRSSKEHYSFRRSNSSVKTHFLQPLSTLHFDTRFDGFGDHLTSKATLWTLSMVGMFILVMAGINFINLSTALAVGRSKEIGIRKVLGSMRRQLFLQVMGETGLLVIVAAVIAVLLAALCLPFIKHIASIPETPALFSFPNLLFLVVLVLVVTVFSGSYPSLVLSGFKPVSALKNKISSATIGGISLRRGLVVLQFAISQVLIIGTIVVISQMHYVRNADLGFDKEAVLLLYANSDSTVISKQQAFKERLLQLPGVQAVSFNSDPPSSDNSWSSNFGFNHKPDEQFQVSMKFADEDYFKTFGLELLAGRVYAKSDTIREMVINETLVKKLGVDDPMQVVGKELSLGGDGWKTVVGVVKDFKTSSLKKAISPLLIAQQSKFYANTSVKLRSANISKSQAAVQKTWDEFFPGYAYTSSFMEDDVNKFYEQENKLSLLFKIFASLAILISALGLFGLVSFMAVQRTREVGIRKVLGASVQNIVFLFSKEFTLLVAVACLVAVPVGYWVMHEWLNDFVYKIKIGAGVFVVTIVLSLVIAWLTVGYKAFSAALANPVKSLGTE